MMTETHAVVDAAHAAVIADREAGGDAHTATAAALRVYHAHGATAADIPEIMTVAGWDRMIARNAALDLQQPETETERAARIAEGARMLATDQRIAREGAAATRHAEAAPRTRHDEESLSQTGRRMVR